MLSYSRFQHLQIVFFFLQVTMKLVELKRLGTKMKIIPKLVSARIVMFMGFNFRGIRFRGYSNLQAFKLI